MDNFNLKQYLTEGKLLKENKKSLKENSDEYIEDENSRYLIDQIADDMMYTEFESKEDIDKFLNSIIGGIERLRKEQHEIWDDINREPEDDFGDEELEEGRFRYNREKDYDDEYMYRGRSNRRSSYRDAIMNPPTPSGNMGDKENPYAYDPEEEN